MEACTQPLYTVTPSIRWSRSELVELWQYKTLFLCLAWRDIRARYKQAFLGIGWAIIQPLFSSGVFAIFFGKIAHMPSDGVAYPVFAFSALIPWVYFSSSVNRGTNCVLANTSLIAKVYFPRLVLPAAMMVPGLVDAVLSLIVLSILSFRYTFSIGLMGYLSIPFLMLLTMFLALGLTLWLGSLNVRIRDLTHAVPFLLQLWMFATPIIYPASIIPKQYQWLVALNPMTGIVNAMRSACFHVPFDGYSLMVSVIMTLVILSSGLLFFRSRERSFVDYL